MGCFDRIGLAKAALSNFIRSLPKDSSFTIISFGSRFEGMQIGEQRGAIRFDDESKNGALN